MKKIVLLTILTSFLFYNFQCNKEEICANRITNRSSVKVDVSPEQLEYSIGDTIWLSTNFDTELEISNSNEVINVANGNGFFRTIIAYLDSGAEVKRGFSDFEIINNNGELNQIGIENENILKYQGQLYFSCDSIYCKFQIGLVPQRTGNYCVTIALGRIGINDTSECPSNNRLEDNTFNVTSHNRELYQEFNLPNTIRLPRSGSTSSLWDVKASDATYTFRIK